MGIGEYGGEGSGAGFVYTHSRGEYLPCMHSFIPFALVLSWGLGSMGGRDRGRAFLCTQSGVSERKHSAAFHSFALIVLLLWWGGGIEGERNDSAAVHLLALIVLGGEDGGADGVKGSGMVVGWVAKGVSRGGERGVKRIDLRYYLLFAFFVRMGDAWRWTEEKWGLAPREFRTGSHVA